MVVASLMKLEANLMIGLEVNLLKEVGNGVLI